MGGGAVGGEPAGDGEGVEELEGDGEEPDEEVDGGDGGGEEGEEDGAVEVVDYLVVGRGQVSLGVWWGRRRDARIGLPWSCSPTGGIRFRSFRAV